MLQLLNRSYEARFLGCHALTSAVTSDVLSRIVRELPPSIDNNNSAPQHCSTTKVNDNCMLLCCASGLIVTPRGNVNNDSDVSKNEQHAHPVVLRVTLNDILFCHVDNKRPDVTVWVVRHSKPNSNVNADEKAINDNVTLNVYMYQCANAGDAIALFQIYNEMSSQAKLQRYNRRSVTVTPSTEQLTNESWNSIADGIENNHHNSSATRHRDREIRDAMMEELRETLRTRYGFDINSDDHVTHKKPLKDVSNMCNNRQRKPAKIISVNPESVIVDSGSEKVNQELIITSPNVINSNMTSSKVAFQFPRSMGDIMKRLVTKNRNNSNDVIIKSSSLPNVNALPERKPSLKKKKKKAPFPPAADFEPEPVRIPNRINNLTEPYFYLPPSTADIAESVTNDETSLTSSVNATTLPPALAAPPWVHHKRVVHDIDHVNVTRNVTAATKRMNGGVKKKIHGQSPALRPLKSISKKKLIVNGTEVTLPTGSIFNRSSSTTSNGSSSSESGPDNKLLRSVMKKPKQTDNVNANENKKNVTFHAYATVQVLP